MSVIVQRHGDIGMSHDVLQILGVHPSVGEAGTECMAHGMGRDVRQGLLWFVVLVVLPDKPLEHALVTGRRFGKAALVEEQEVSVAPDIDRGGFPSVLHSPLQRLVAERLGMNSRTIIDLETCQSNPKFETVVLVAKELNISVDAAIFPEMVNQTVSKTVVDFFAGKSEAEIEKFIALCKQAETFQKDE